MKKIVTFITLLSLILVSNAAFSQCRDCPVENCGEKGKSANYPDFDKTLKTLSEISRQYAYFRSEAADSGFTSSYVFKYSNEDVSVVTVTTAFNETSKPVLGEHKDTRTGEVLYSHSEQKTAMVPQTACEFEYKFDLSNFDLGKSHLVSWQDQTGKLNPPQTSILPMQDPSQSYTLKYPYCRVDLMTKGGKKKITVRNVKGVEKTSSVSIYFQERNQAEDFLRKFQQAAEMKKAGAVFSEDSEDCHK